MKNIKWGTVGGVVVLAGAMVGSVALPADASPAPELRQTAAVAPANSVDSRSLIDYSVNQSDIAKATFQLARTPGFQAVTGWSVKDGSLGLPDFSEAAKAALKGKDGTNGVTNLESDSPYPGATQLGDNPGNGANSTVKFVGGKPTELQRAWVQCADGKTAIGGGYQRADEGAAAIKNLQIVTSSPTQIKAGAEVYEPIAGDKAGSVKPNAWLVEGFNNGDTDLIVRPSVICANVG